MRIFDLQATTSGDIHTLAATVAWENQSRPTMEVYFRVRSPKSPFDTRHYNAFLVACLIPAVFHGETRIRVEGAVCPWLVDHLTTLLAYQNHWYGYDRGHARGATVALEAQDYIQYEEPRPARVGLFFSGGVDSLYSLRKNQLTLPVGHPGRISDAIFVHGFDFGVRPQRGSEEDTFAYFLKNFEPIFQEAGIQIIPVWTNLQLLGIVSYDFWNREFMGPAMGAVAHALSGRLTDVLVASTYFIRDLHPYSSHPLIEPRLGSFSLRLHHDAERVRRLEKVATLADWPVALAHLRVCFFGKPGMLNCGVCGKCIRTKLELLCTGKSYPEHIFADNRLGAGLILKQLHLKKTDAFFFDDLIRALFKAGYYLLAAAVAVKRVEYGLRGLVNPRGLITWVDKQLLGAGLKRLYHRFKSPPHRN
ncbi:hypothetical protein [Methylomagnum sp.]